MTQPPEQQPTSQQPWQPQPGGDAGAPGGAPPPDPATRKRTFIIVAAVVGLVVAIIAGSIVYTVQANRRAEEAAAQEAAERVAGAAAAVQGLFDAIVAGDAATALSHIDVPGVDTSAITDEALAASAEVAPITDVVVTPPAEVGEHDFSTVVAVSYQLGDVAVDEEYQVRDPERDGTWVVDGAVVQASFDELPEGLAITLNGDPLTSTEVMLLPGAYRLGVSTDYYMLTSESEFQVTDAYHAYVPSLEFALDDDGVAAFRDAITDAVEECVSSSSLETGCGLAIPAELSDGTELDDGTLERTLSDDAQEALESLEPTLSSSEPTVATAGYIGQVDVVADCTKDDQSGTCTVRFAPSLSAPSVVMTDPDLPVSWD